MPESDDFAGWARRYLEAKSAHDAEMLMTFFDHDVTYEDAVLGRRTGWLDLRSSYERIFDALPLEARSRLLWAAGDETGGVLRFDNDAAYFGAEMEVLAVVELREQRVIGQRDYWDGLQIGREVLQGMRDRFPPRERSERTGRALGTPVDGLLGELAEVLWSDRAGVGTIGNLLAEDVEMYDLAAGTEVSGRSAVVKHLAAIWSVAPYGSGATATGFVGGDQGGGLEWAAAPTRTADVGGGALGIRCGPQGIRDLVWSWDASRLAVDVVESIRKRRS